MTIAMPVVKTLKLSEITPYGNNPRRIPAEAVAKVRESLENYGYQQPIVVDHNNVIVVGHTRFLAMQEMGIDSAQVYVTDLSEEKANEYRLVDNQTGEMSDWDHSALVMELREWEGALMASFFPEIDLEIGSLTSALKDVTQKDMDSATEKVAVVRALEPAQSTTVICPSCYYAFEVKTNTLPGLSQIDLEVIEAARSTGAADGSTE